MVLRPCLSKAPPRRGRGWGGGYRPCARPISPTAPRLAGKPASLAAPPLQGRGERASRIQYRREPAIDHPLAVKGLVVRIVLHPLVGHDLFPARDARFLARPFDPAEHRGLAGLGMDRRSEEHTSELQSLMRISYAVFC